MSGIESGGGTAFLFQGDITNASEVKALFTATVDRFGGLDILINNAELNEKAPLEQVTEEHFHKHFHGNVLRTLHPSREASEYLQATPGLLPNIGALSSTHPATGPP